MDFQDAPVFQPEGQYAGGGHVKKAPKSDFVLAHMSPQELRELEEIQGGEQYGKYGLKHLGGVGELVNNPHMLQAGVEGHYAHGGEVAEDLQRMRQDGRYGDTRLALVPRKLSKIFNKLLGGVSRNPRDGHPEYFGLGGFIKGLAKKVMPSGGIGNMVRRGFNAMTGGQNARQFMGQMGRSALQGVGQMAQNMGQGQNMGQAARAGFTHGMANMDNPMGRTMNAVGQSMMGGQGVGNSMMRGVAAGSQGFNNPMARAAQGFANSHLQGQGMGNSMMQGISQGSQGMDNPMARAARGFADSRLEGQGYGQSLMGGAQEGLRDINNDYAQGAREGINSFRRGDSLDRAGARGLARGLEGMRTPAGNIGRAMATGYGNTGSLGHTAMRGVEQGTDELEQYMNRAYPTPTP